MKATERLGMIGSGASSIYLLKHFLGQMSELKKFIGSIHVFERDELPGIGMPYHPGTTDVHNLCNISSREIPRMVEPLFDWLKGQPTERLDQWGILRESLSEGALYPRLALGAFFREQFERLCEEIRENGVDVTVTPGCEIVDVVQKSSGGKINLISRDKSEFEMDRVFVCTGHQWPEEDVPRAGYFSSPWPIAKLLPNPGEFFNFEVGLLGASLSAFDVVTSLAHRQGCFVEQEGKLKFIVAPGAEGFRIFLHTKEGRLPQLQFEQVRPLRKLYRHISREDLLSLLRDGWLRLADYFNVVCRPLLHEAFCRDGRMDVAKLLGRNEQGCSLEDFVATMTREHEYDDAFEGMRRELAQEQRRGERPVHWKELLDDLMYTLNFHVEMLPAEDHQQLTRVVMPFLLNVMAAMPLPSARILLALREADCIDIVEGAVLDVRCGEGKTFVTVEREAGHDPTQGDGVQEDLVKAHCYSLFVDCSGQSPIELETFPFPSLVENGQVRRAWAGYANPAHRQKKEQTDSKIGEFEGRPVYYVGGIEIDPTYRVVSAGGQANDRLYDLSFPHTAGVRPYSYGLQACEATAALAVASLVKNTSSAS
jgi:FAD-NAD(P)-binding